MAIDPSIILGIKAPEIDPIGAAQKAMTMKQLAMQNQNMERDQVFKEQQQKLTMDAAQAEKQMRNLELTARLAGSATDQASYERALGLASQQGLNVGDLPKEFDPGLMRQYQNMAMSQKEKLEQQWKQKSFELEERKLASQALDRREARDERRFQHGIKLDEKMQGLKTPYGLANTEDDAKQLKSAFEMKQEFDGKLQEMIDLRQKHGGGALLNREDVARGKQLSKDLLLAYKNMAKLGVLSKSDEDIINAIVPEDPLQYNSMYDAITGQDPTLHRLKKFKEDSERDFSTKVGTRTRKGIDSVATQGQATKKFEPDVLSYAQKHGISPEEAQQIKSMRTSGKTAGR